MSAADERAKELWPPRIFHGKRFTADWNVPLREAFVAGAEWQAEQDKTGLDAVSKLHRPARLVRGETEFCRECIGPWPCHTIRALEERTDR